MFQAQQEIIHTDYKNEEICVTIIIREEREELDYTVNRYYMTDKNGEVDISELLEIKEQYRSYFPTAKFTYVIKKSKE
jgi:hypothetical protein